MFNHEIIYTRSIPLCWSLSSYLLSILTCSSIYLLFMFYNICNWILMLQFFRIHAYQWLHLHISAVNGSSLSYLHVLHIDSFISLLGLAEVIHDFFIGRFVLINIYNTLWIPTIKLIAGDDTIVILNILLNLL